MEVQGRIKMIDETKTYGNNGFRKREVVVTTEEQYPQHILVEFVQDKCDLLNNYSVGQMVKISINLRGMGKPTGRNQVFQLHPRLAHREPSARTVRCRQYATCSSHGGL